MKKNKVCRVRRNIEDAPFYRLKYKYDELPLDPAKPFIIEQIEKIKRLKSVEFLHDFELFAYVSINSKLCVELPSRITIVQEREIFSSTQYYDKILRTYGNKLNFYPDCKYLESSPELVVSSMMKNIISTYINCRMKIFHEARAKSSLYSSIFKKYRFDNKAFCNKCKVPLKRKVFHAGDETIFRSTEVLLKEKIEIAKIIDELIEPDMNKFKEKSKLCKTIEQFCIQESKKSRIRNSLLKKKKKLIKFPVPILTPCCPETQKAKLINQYEKMFSLANEKFSDEIKQRTLNLMELMSVLYIEIYPSNLLKKIIPKIDKKLQYLKHAYKFIIKEQKLWPNIYPEIILLDYLFNVDNQIPLAQATLIICLLIDLQEDYRYHVKRSFLKYILNQSSERERLQLEQEPPEFPIVTIQAPVLWRASVQIAKNRLDLILMTYHPVLQAVNLLWQQLYQDLFIIDTTQFYHSNISLHAETVTEMLKKSCLVARDILLNDWLPRVADLLDATRPFWENLVSKKTNTCGRAEILFKCIHALMSYQLSEFIMRSVHQLFNILNNYKSNTQENKPPFMTITVAVIGKYYDDTETEAKNRDSKLNNLNEDDPSILSIKFDDNSIILEKSADFVLKNCGKIFIDPYMEDLAELFVSYFRQILRVGYKIPRMEYYMTRDKRKISFLHCCQEDRIDMLSLYEKVRVIVNANLDGPTIYLYPIYTYYFQLLNGKMKIITENIFCKQIVPGLFEITDLMKKFHEILIGIYFLRDYVPLNLFMLDNRRVNRVLSHLVNELKNFVTNYFITLNQVENRRLCDEFESISLHAGERPSETPEVVALQNFLSECREERLFKLKSDIKMEVSKRVLFLLQYGDLDSEDIHLNSRTFLWPEELEQVLDLSAARLSVVRESLEESLKERRSNFEIFIAQEEKKVDIFRLKALRDVLTHEELKEKVKMVDELMEIIENFSREAKAINIDENLLQLEISIFPVLASVIEKMDVIEKLWRTAYQFEICYEKWFYGKYIGLNAELIQEEVDQMWKVLQKLIKQLVSNPQARRLAEQIRLKLDKFKMYLPVLESICRQGLSARHWDQISGVLNIEVTPEYFPTLNSLIEIDIMSVIEKLEEISNSAGREYELDHQLIVMKNEWTSVRFEICPYRDSDTHILSALDDIQTLLDDHILKAQAMRGSPYISALGKKATDWEDKLINMQDIMDAWVQVQSTWMYLEPIFSSEDILKQMPTEGRNFKSVDRIWKKIMKNTSLDTRVLQATDYPQLIKLLQKSFKDLEDIQKGLNMYLEKKRLFFARFFFLSNDELLEILSETKDPLRVQPHLKKCFEGINSLEFDQNGEILAMVSFEKEVVPLTRKINPNTANGLVEKWLKEVQIVMLETLHEQIRQSYDTYWNDIRSDWVLKWPGQVITCVSCLTWTGEVEEAIGRNLLPNYLNKCTTQIKDLVQLVRGTLSLSATITIESLIVLDVHSRDIVQSLIDKELCDVGDFIWFSQLRYYWRIDPIDKQDYITASMVSTDVRYGMEYLGNQPRLVVTPLTDRCYRTLMGAYRLNLGGAPEGPAGTGKTETCKDLAKAVAKKCVVFNCSDGLDYKALGKFFKGLAQSGSWACFDEFNRIEIEVLSVVAQQILTIQRAVARKVFKFIFEDTMLQIDISCNIFITMNPGYAGRSDLPDNLKVLFRTVAMMVPDFALIGEITLYSNGFDSARKLSQKIVHTYKLCSEQLSSQHHYDYGMRAVKSVLIASGTLRKLYPQLTEEKIVLRAIIDVNLPKFLQQDVPLFEGIYKDLFPGVDIPQSSRTDIMKWLYKKIKENKLQPTTWFIERIMQIYEMLLVRHGIMIVGGSMSGKTTAYQLLAQILQQVKKDNNSIIDEHGVNYKIINPKAISIGQLYGYFSASHEWTDGVIAKTFREMAYYDTKERQWIVFDGPVDAIWIENLNTALDDNKKLCLMSGEIIHMSKTMNLFFEPSDLEQASPATVSRAGMIYMESSQLGWQALHKSFMYQLEDFPLNEIYISLYEELVEWLVPAILEVIISCRVMLEISQMHCYRTLSTFFMIFLSQTEQYNQFWFQQTFLFCLAWAYGSTLTTDGKKEFDALLRKVLYGGNETYPKSKHFSLNRGQMYPEKQTALDFFFEGENWWPWLKTDDVIFPSDAQVMELMVPTKETGFIHYWLEICLKKSLPILIVGPTGTGKSATIYNYMIKLAKEKYLSNTINFSANTSASQVQEIVMSKLDRRRKGVFGPPVGKMYLMFVDDIAMSARDAYGSQPPLELLRQWMEHKYWFDLRDSSKFEVADMMIISAMSLAGGSNFIYPRIYRHMFVIGVDSFEDSTIVRIFSKIGEWHFAKGFGEIISKFTKNLSSALVEISRESKLVFLPTPAKSHYMFSLRDVTKIFQGIVLVPCKRLQSLEKLTRLWVHETLRVFSDRLIEQSDKDLLLKLLRNACKTNLRLTLEQAFVDKLEKGESVSEEQIRDLQFGNYMEPDADPRIYDEIEDLVKLENIMSYYLTDFNSNSNSPMDLVLFRFALEHISRVSRVFNMSRGNILLVGLGGSGRRSSIKLAASMADLDLIQIEVKKSYTLTDWREDIKKILLHAGMDAKPTVFLFCDSQAKEESFIEDINTLLNTGDLPNLFQSEEKATILEKMQIAAKNLDKSIDTTPLALYGFFIERIRESLHIALAFSPIGDSFKRRLRIYPSFINCCTMDWFSAWPNDALLRVAEHFIKSVNIAKDNMGEEVLNQISIPVIQNIDKKRKLSQIEMKLVQMVVSLNFSVVNANERFFVELGRKNYVTPTSYLEMLRLFKILFNKKFNEITIQRIRYTTGLEKLESAAGQVSVMQENLYELQPQLKITSEETERIMVNIERETAEAEKKKEVVGADESAANEAAAAAQAIKDDCESDLQEAIPAMESALSALDTLKPADVTLVKSMKNPPAGVKLVLEAVCVMKGFKPERKPDATGRMIEDYWSPSVRMLGDMKFLESLKSFDKDNIPGPIMKKIRDTYIADRDFVPEKIKNISTACEGLCRWTRAIEIYDRVAKIVAPKKIALSEAETELGQQMEKLNSKRAELQVILDKLQKLNDFFAEKSREKKRLEDEIDNCEKKLVRAEKLLGGLGGEKIRWSETASNLHKSLDNIVGDVLLAAGCVAYLGCFTTEYRAEILTHWNELCLKEGIPCSSTFSLPLTLGNAMEIRSWTLCGLPIDNYSIENGLIVTNTRRWPLMIDPQVQANKWIRNMEKDNELQIIKLSDTNYLRVVENSIRQGLPLLLENIGEFIDFGLFTVLEKNVVKHKSGYFIKFGDGMIEYNHNFRFYLTSCLSNPHYLPETAIMVTLLNFAITEQGLREQLLATVVIQERPDLQEKKEQLIVESAKNRDTLYTIESKILQVLSSSEGNILEDENAINILSSSKLLSEEIQIKQVIAAATEEEIDRSRQMYIPVSQNSVILFFCITELANIEAMYQYSLSWFLNLFKQTILKAPKSEVLSKRLNNLNHYFTRSIYENVCRSLFEKDKLVFSFVICIGILRSQMKIDESHLKFFLIGGITGHDDIHPNPAEWLADKAWTEIVRASNLKGLENFYIEFSQNIIKWKEYYDLSSPQENLFPDAYSDINDLLKLIILKCIRPDKVVPAVRKFIILHMDKFFIEPPSFNLVASFNDSNSKIPLIFVLTSGLDPMSNLLSFAKEKNMYDKCKTISLGQGQGHKAEKLITDGIKYGHWIVLQNCHVAASWMNNLERICLETIDLDYIHSNYRLWLTSYPSKIIPVSILQNSIKMTNESPKGLKMNLLKSLNSDPLNNDKFFNNAFVGDVSKYWLRGVFSLLFFHAIIQERREFGPLGWNIPYEFNESDLRISIMQLKAFLKQYSRIPFQGHKYLTGECNYGGRVTDDKDRHLLMTLLDQLYNENSVDVENYSLSDSGLYTIPLVPNMENCIDYVHKLPIVVHPEVFGLHENADISKNMNETNTLLLGVFLTQTKLNSCLKGGNNQVSASDLVTNFCTNISERLPMLFDINIVSKKFPFLYNNSMNTVLLQELMRYNRLLQYIKLSLSDVTRAISGKIALLPEIESIYNSISFGRIPETWAKKSYPSLKPLGSYINDLLARLQVFTKWIDFGEPDIHWLSGFYFTQSFITGVLQNFSRKNAFQIDLISMKFEIIKFESEAKSTPEIGVYIKGIFLEGARWNRVTMALDESYPKILFDKLPIIKMSPELKTQITPIAQLQYDCPIYKTSERRGELSTTGHSTNFVMFIELNTIKPPYHWTKRGTACLCQLDD